MYQRNAQEHFRSKFPQAECVRGTFGLTVFTDDTHTREYGNGEAWWEEEAWVSAVEDLEDE